ncbi:MAG TPA: DUF4145 domain-containing protein [Candidatus Binatia bacterium]
MATAETVNALTFGNVEEADCGRRLKWAERMASGRPFLEVHRQFRSRDVQNVSISYCFNCNDMCLWVYDKLVWPRSASDPEPKLHASPAIQRNDEGGSQTLDASPRGATALLRLAIEKVCKELGEAGERTKDVLESFVQEDVDARVQKVLEAMRIIESNAVPPAQIGVGDNRAIGETLSGLVYLICEKMIIEPKHLQAMYTKLREGAQPTAEHCGRSCPGQS